MFRKGLVFFLVFLFIPLFLFAERPHFGLEWDFFFPRGDWAENMGLSHSFKLSIQQMVTENLGVGISAGSVSFSRELPADFTLSMFPVVYLDLIVEKQIKNSSPIYVGLFIGPNYTKQKVSYREGEEKASIWGWGTGGCISLRFKSAVIPFLKTRYISRKDTGGLEVAIGVSI